MLSQAEARGTPLAASTNRDGTILYWLEWDDNDISLCRLTAAGNASRKILQDNIGTAISANHSPRNIAVRAVGGGVAISAGSWIGEYNDELRSVKMTKLEEPDLVYAEGRLLDEGGPDRVEIVARLFDAFGETLWIIGPSAAKYREFIGGARSSQKTTFPSEEDYVCVAIRMADKSKVSCSAVALTAEDPGNLVPKGNSAYIFRETGCQQLTADGVRQLAHWKFPSSANVTSATVDDSGNVWLVASWDRLYRGSLRGPAVQRLAPVLLVGSSYIRLVGTYGNNPFALVGFDTLRWLSGIRPSIQLVELSNPDQIMFVSAGDKAIGVLALDRAMIVSDRPTARK